MLPSVEEGEAIAARFMAAYRERLTTPPREPHSSRRGLTGQVRSALVPEEVAG